MRIELKQINRSNYDDCIKLKVKEEQKKFVATNMFSLVQAAYEPQLYPLGVYLEDEMVGFILYDFDTELNGWSMSRFMIDLKHQHKGIGRKALKEFIEFFKANYPQEDLYTSAEVDNPIAISLYEKFGFEKRNVFEYGYDGMKFVEIRMVLKA